MKSHNRFNGKGALIIISIVLLLIISKNDSQTKNGLMIGLCAIGKKENLYAEEYVEHYKNLGYNHIFIYDNNNIGDERFQDVLSKYINDNFVTIIDYMGYRGKINRPQFDAYYDCYQKNSNNYDWLSFYDFDEFLELRNNKSIKEFLSNKVFNKCQNIKINWMIYSDNGLTYYDNRKIQDRFTKPLINASLNRAVKSTVRGHMKINFWNNMSHPHSSNVNITTCSSTGEIVKDYQSIWLNPPNYKNAYLKHYETKTIEEYINKIKRGRSDRVVFLDKNYLRSKLKYFFSKNKRTKDKLNYIQKALNITFK